jgi:hypothetical protein
MNTDKKVFEKLFSKEKLELESQKYEFGIKEDFANNELSMKAAAEVLLKAANDGDEIQKQVAKLQADYTKQIGLVKKLYAAAEKEDNNMSKIFDKAKIAADNVGIKMDAIPGYASWWASGFTIKKAIDAGDKYLAM